MDLFSYLIGKKSSSGGVDLSEYFKNEISNGTSSSKVGWKDVVIKVPSPLTIKSNSAVYMFSGYPATEIPTLSMASEVTLASCSYMFNSCRQVKEFDLSNLDLSHVTDVTYMFYYCQSAEKIDIRTLDNTVITASTQMMTNVPSNCLVIVKDSEFKTWLENKFPSLTNIKTVSEYEE